MSSECSAPQPQLFPDDLARSVPRAVPAWARPRRWAAAACLACVAGLIVLVGVAAGVGIAVASSFIAVPTAVAVLAFTHARLRLLRHGIPAVAIVTRVHYLHGLRIEYEYDTPAGRRRGATTVGEMSVLKRYGHWPIAGNAAFIVYDLKSALADMLWSLPEQNRAWNDRRA